MAAAYPSGTNTFVRSHEASDRMIVDFGRNPNSFPVNKYAQLKPVKKMSGYYLEFTLEEAARILQSNLADHVWGDGQPSSEFNDQTESFEFKAFECIRYAFGFTIGDLGADQADWNLIGQHTSIKTRQAMTARTQLAVTEYEDTTKYAASHTSAVASISGNTGRWDQSTTARQDIKRSLNHAAEVIWKDSLGVVNRGDMVLVVNPELANALSETQEIVDHIKHSDHALAQIRGELPGNNVEFNLPDHLYGYEVVVENTVKVTSKKGATRVADYLADNTKAALLSRPGALVAPEDAPSFSTLTLFSFEELTVETLKDNVHRRTLGRVVENHQALMTAPVTGFLFTTTMV